MYILFFFVSINIFSCSTIDLSSALPESQIDKAETKVSKNLLKNLELKSLEENKKNLPRKNQELFLIDDNTEKPPSKWCP